MEKITVRIKTLREGARVPSYGSENASGADLYACVDAPVTVAPSETVMVPTGLSAQIPSGYGGFVFARSGLSVKKGLSPANKVGVIDSDYRGEIMIALHNHSAVPATIDPYERVAQLVFLQTPQADFFVSDELTDTARGAGGFGSTGG